MGSRTARGGTLRQEDRAGEVQPEARGKGFGEEQADGVGVRVFQAGLHAVSGLLLPLGEEGHLADEARPEVLAQPCLRHPALGRGGEEGLAQEAPFLHPFQGPWGQGEGGQEAEAPLQGEHSLGAEGALVAEKPFRLHRLPQEGKLGGAGEEGPWGKLVAEKAEGASRGPLQGAEGGLGRTLARTSPAKRVSLSALRASPSSLRRAQAVRVVPSRV